MTDLPLHRRPVRNAACEQARFLIEQATEACGRLRDSSDLEALHDLRVGVRRLRTVIRAYREHLPFGKRVLERLRGLTRRTNALRDSEVARDWLLAQRDELSAGHRVGADWLTARVSAEQQREYDELRVELPIAWTRLEAELSRRLERVVAEGQQPTFGEVSRRLVRKSRQRLADRLAEVKEIHDEIPAHEARIAAKRLRYLLEPFRVDLVAAGPVVRGLRKFQDAFGDLNDSHLMLTRLGEHLAEAVRSTQLPNEQPGLMRLAVLARERRDRSFGEIRERYLGRRARSFLAPIDRIADRLANMPRGGS